MEDETYTDEERNLEQVDTEIAEEQAENKEDTKDDKQNPKPE